MKISFRKIGLGSIGVFIACTMVTTTSFAKSDFGSNSNNNYTEEWNEAVSAASQMDANSQRLMMNGIGAPSSFDLSSQDLETVIMAVQAERVQLLTEQMSKQLEEVQKRLAEIDALNNEKNEAIASGDPAKAAELEGQLNRLSNTQQMDMLRLQSITNKRNEAFDMMSEFVKKMQDSRQSIIGNMR